MTKLDSSEMDVQFEVVEKLKTLGIKSKQNRTNKNNKRPDIQFTEPYIGIIEVKNRNVLIDNSVKKQVMEYALSSKKKPQIIYATNGLETKTWDINGNDYIVNNKPVTEILPKFIENGHVDTAPTGVTKEELISLFKWANNLLRDREGLSILKRFTEFTDLLFLKLLSTADIKIPTYMKFEELIKEEDPQKLYDLIIGKVWEWLTKNHGELFEDNTLEIKNPEVVYDIVQKLGEYDFEHTDVDIKGACFEYFLADMMTGGGMGQFFTPREIVNKMVDMVNLETTDTVYDPACGTGGFLTVAMKRMLERAASTQVKNKIKKNLTGIDLNPDAALIAKMNMILSGDGRTNITQQDSLLSDPGQYDIILANPPYGMSSDAFKQKPKNFYTKSNNGENLFVQHMLKSLAPNGRMTVLLPTGILFANQHKELRRIICENFNLKSITTLPAGTFKPYTMIETCILNIENNGPTTEVNFDGIKLSIETLVEANYLFSKNINNVEVVHEGGIEYKRLDELFEIKKGKRSSRNYEDGNIPFYVCSPDIKTVASHAYNIEALLVADGGVPGIHYINGKFDASDHTFILTNKNSKALLSKYAYYFIKSNLSELGNLYQGVTIKNLSKTSLSNFKIPILPIEQQKEIIKKGELIESTINTLKNQIKQEREIVESLPSLIQIVGEYKRLKEITEINYGTRITQKNNSGTKYPVYGGGDITFYTDNFNRENTFIIGRFGVSEKCVRWVKEKFWLHDNGLSLKITDTGVMEKYLYYFLLSKQMEIFNASRGTAQRALSMDEFKNLTILIPPLETQKKIIEMGDKIIEMGDKIIEMGDYKQRLIDDLKNQLGPLTETL